MSHLLDVCTYARMARQVEMETGRCREGKSLWSDLDTSSWQSLWSDWSDWYLQQPVPRNDEPWINARIIRCARPYITSYQKLDWTKFAIQAWSNPPCSHVLVEEGDKILQGPHSNGLFMTPKVITPNPTLTVYL
jgi:hypothetical protein